jgi:anhydro-N-acetylmuramic acid kinase
MRVIGLMSGTSVDGIDAALVDISGSTHDLRVELLVGQTSAYPEDLRQRVLAVGAGQCLSMPEFAKLDDAIAHEFAQAAIALHTHQPAADLIGSHGQTVFHRPPTGAGNNLHLGYSLQLGRGAMIAHQTGIPTITNFRVADIAAAGQGAPLVPPVDAALLTHPTYHRCIQNLGGIGNVTYLPARNSHTAAILGWDTGPGNMLLDLAVQQLSNGEKNYDQDGAWAASGTPAPDLVSDWLRDPFFQQAPPKSTGREYFGRPYLHRCLAAAQQYNLSSADILATLTDFTAATIAHSYRTFLPQMPDEVLLCGGGSKNQYLIHRCRVHLPSVSVLATDDVGLSAEYKEAIAFAVLAYWRYHGIPGNLPQVTGARTPVLLGEIHPVTFGAA